VRFFFQKYTTPLRLNRFRFGLTRFILKANVVVMCTILRFSQIQTGGWGSVERQSSASCFSFSVSQLFSSFFFSRSTVIIGKEKGVWKTCFRVFATRYQWMMKRQKTINDIVRSRVQPPARRPRRRLRFANGRRSRRSPQLRLASAARK